MYARLKPKGTGCSLAPTQSDGTVIVERTHADVLVKLHGFTLIEILPEMPALTGDEDKPGKETLKPEKSKGTKSTKGI
ncbi:MAG: hypothetical protein ABFD81_19105 [Syntrophaceae bacterium]